MRAPDHVADAAPAADAAQVDAAPAADAPPVSDAAPAAEDGTALGGAGTVEGDVTPKLDADGKPIADAAPAGAPEAYALAAPEGMTLDTDALALAEPVFRELGLDNEKAQKLTDAYAQIVPKIAERIEGEQATQITAQRKSWFDEAKADPEIGGAQWSDSLASSAKALDRLGAPAGSPFRELLNVSGLGNHPEMIRMFVKIGKAIGEDGDFISAKTTKPKTTEEKYYGPRT